MGSAPGEDLLVIGPELGDCSYLEGGVGKVEEEGNPFCTLPGLFIDDEPGLLQGTVVSERGVGFVWHWVGRRRERRNGLTFPTSTSAIRIIHLHLKKYNS